MSKRALIQGEREVAMTLHGSLMFLAIRKHIYRMPMPDGKRSSAARNRSHRAAIDNKDVWV